MSDEISAVVNSNPESELEGDFSRGITEFGLVLKETILVFKSNWKHLVSILLIPMLPTLLLFVLAIPAVLMGPALKDNIPVMVIWGIIGVVIVIVSIVLYLISTSAMMYIVNKLVQGGQVISLRDSYREGRKLFWGYAWITILTMCVLVGSFALLIIPGIIFSVFIMFGLPILYAEGKRGLDALQASWNYVSGHWWKLFIFLLVLYILIASARLISWIVIDLPLSFVKLDFIPQVVFQLVLTPVTIIFLFVVYKHFKSAYDSHGVAAVEKNRKPLIVVATVIGFIMVFMFIPLAIFLASKYPSVKEFAPSQIGQTDSKSAWISYTSPKNDFSVMLPMQPENDIGNGVYSISQFTVDVEEFIAYDSVGAYIIDVDHLPPGTVITSSLVDESIDSYLEYKDYPVVLSNQNVTFSGLPAKEYIIEIQGETRDVGKVLVKFLTFANRGKIYKLMYAQGQDTVEKFREDSYRQFVDSFKLL